MCLQNGWFAVISRAGVQETNHLRPELVCAATPGADQQIRDRNLVLSHGANEMQRWFVPLREGGIRSWWDQCDN